MGSTEHLDWTPVWATKVLSAITHLDNKIESLQHQVQGITQRLGNIMTDVKIAQETLDADGDKLTQLAADLQQIIASGNLSAADQTKLQSGLDALTGLDTLQVTPPPAG